MIPSSAGRMCGLYLLHGSCHPIDRPSAAAYGFPSQTTCQRSRFGSESCSLQFFGVISLLTRSFELKALPDPVQSSDYKSADVESAGYGGGGRVHTSTGKAAGHSRAVDEGRSLAQTVNCRRATAVSTSRQKRVMSPRSRVTQQITSVRLIARLANRRSLDTELASTSR